MRSLHNFNEDVPKIMKTLIDSIFSTMFSFFPFVAPTPLSPVNHQLTRASSIVTLYSYYINGLVSKNFKGV